jgi:transposase
MGRSKQRKTTPEAAAGGRPLPALDRRFLDLTPEQVTDLLGRIDAVASPEDAAVVRGMAATVRCLDEEIKTKGTSIRRLRALAFGAVTETTRNLFPPEPGKPKAPREPKEPKPGHGPKGSTAYPTAERVKVPHGTLKTGDCCPECLKGRLYPKGQPAVMVRIVGLSPLAAKVIEREALRCNGCGETFTAAPPEGVGAQKYDETVPAMVALFRFGTGMPYARFARFQQNLGVPLPASTMNDLVMHSAELLEPALDELIRWAAQGELIHQDDTVMKLLDRPDLCKDGKKKGRKGVYTTGLISKLGRNRVALFITGMQHAGENLADLLKRRMADLPKPIQMCDAAAANTSKRVSLDTIVAHCLAHARRKFVEVVDRFPDGIGAGPGKRPAARALPSRGSHARRSGGFPNRKRRLPSAGDLDQESSGRFRLDPAHLDQPRTSRRLGHASGISLAWPTKPRRKVKIGPEAGHYRAN